MKRVLPMLVIAMVLLSGCDFGRVERISRRMMREPLRAAAPDFCPVTLPPVPAFHPPNLPPPPEDIFWYGSADLWVALPIDGIWRGLSYDYTQKVFWGREGYVWTEEPLPALSASGRRLDAPADPADVSPATNGYEETYGSFMLVGVNFPT
ncbi:MAG: hypothetical protein EHM39_03015, partial [Chloroflexi bacterium]